MRNSTEILSIQSRESETLIDDLFIALREVAVREGGLPSSLQAIKWIKNVQEIHHELEFRNVSLNEKILELNKQTNWLMDIYLQDCLSWPKTIPLVRENDGIRRLRRCCICRKAEMPLSGNGMPFCDLCLNEIGLILEKGVSTFSELMLISPKIPDTDCGHVYRNSLIISYEYNEDFTYYYCKKCVLQELVKRKKLSL